MFHKPAKSPFMPLLPALYLLILALYLVWLPKYPVVALTGIGTLGLVSALLIEANRTVIWDTYRKNYKKQKFANRWREPKRVYYVINVAVLWPLIAVLSIGCIWIATTLVS